MNNRKIIETTLAEGHQTQTYRKIYKVNDLKIKIEIQSGSYPSANYARAYVLKDLEWNLIYSIFSSDMKTPLNLKYSNKLKNHVPFFNDAKELETKIEEILF